MKHLLNLPEMIFSNAGLGMVCGMSGAAYFEGGMAVIGAMMAGPILGAFNGIKFPVVSAITDYFSEPEDSTSIKVGTNLVIDAGLACLFAVGLQDDDKMKPLKYYLGVGAFISLGIMDAMNFWIENKDDSEYPEVSDNEYISGILTGVALSNLF